MAARSEWLSHESDLAAAALLLLLCCSNGTEPISASRARSCFLARRCEAE